MASKRTWRAAHIVMYGTRRLSNPSNLEKVLTVLEGASLGPTGWSFDSRTNLPYSRKEVLSRASKEKYLLNLRHEGKVKYEAGLELGKWPEIVINFDAGTPQEYWKSVFDVSPQLVKAFQPDIALTSVSLSYEIPPKMEWDRNARSIYEAASLLGKHHFAAGPVGLADRTYLGPHYVMQFGKELLLSTPAASVREEDGGITIDLIEPPWNSEPNALIEAWNRAMAHLRPAEIFAIPNIGSTGLILNYKRAPRCHIGGKAPEEKS